MLNSLLWKSNFGENQTNDKAYIRSIFKTMAFISGVVTFGLLWCSYLFNFGEVYMMFNVMVPVLFFGIYLLDVLKKYKWSRFYGTTVLPTYINIITICSGGGFSETLVMLAFLVFAYVLYDKNPRLKFQIIFYNLFCHIAVLTYVAFLPPLIAVINYPFDEVVVFFLAIGWIYVFLKKHEYVKNKFMLQLQDKNKVLLDTTEELERFTYIASHDLKSPLRTIISFSDLSNIHLKKKQYDKVEEDLKFIKSGAQQMNYLIKDILEFSQINGKTEIEKKKIDLNEVLENVTSNLYEEINQAKAKIMKSELPFYYGNKTEFVLLFQNLIQNGIKYNTSQEPTIHIWAKHSNTSLSIYVEDNGIGIEETYHEKIFQYFKRLHTSEEYQGTGLGLGLCKKLIEKYEGKITVQSEQGTGSTFIIELPLVKGRENNSREDRKVSKLQVEQQD